MTNKSSKFARLPSAGGLGLWLALILSFPGPGLAVERQTIAGHVPEAVARLNLKPLGRLPGSDEMRLVIGLPLRNKEALASLLEQLYDPASPSFHRYLDPAQFTQLFGPTEHDYQRVINFAKANRLDVRNTYGDRVLLDVSAPVSTIESAFHVSLQTYQHPTEARQFFAPDVEPSVDVDVPIISVSGLNNFYRPHPMAHGKPASAGGGSPGGSGPSGLYGGTDFRNAYAPGVTLTGAGQMVGLVEFEGYWTNDIMNYESLAGFPNVPLQNVPLDGFSGPNDGDDTFECSLDIEMAIAMAPGLSEVVVFEDYWDVPYSTDHILQSMASNNQIKQLSLSWGLVYDVPSENYLMQMASQGQAFFTASGDHDAYVSGCADNWPDDDPWVTSVGGTQLTMSGNGASYVSETVWNSFDSSSGVYWGSGGGISTTYPIPFWQQIVNLGPVGGSTAWRNIPDVAMVAADLWIYCDDGWTYVDCIGTSFAAPLWAGFTALVNQQLAADGRQPVGFINPALYAIGESANYNSCFNDITTGDNTWSGSPAEFFAAPGYDLCTGWGSPKGANLIRVLEAYAGVGFGVGLDFVDFNYTGPTQNGLYETPFETLAQGINAVPAGGAIIFKATGSSSETMTISKPMTLNTIGGTATIGRAP